MWQRLLPIIAPPRPILLDILKVILIVDILRLLLDKLGERRAALFSDSLYLVVDERAIVTSASTLDRV